MARQAGVSHAVCRVGIREGGIICVPNTHMRLLLLPYRILHLALVFAEIGEIGEIGHSSHHNSGTYHDAGDCPRREVF